MEHAIEWLEANKTAAMDAATFQEFCATQGHMGEFFEKYVWLPKYWEFLKLRGYVPYKSVLLPAARAYTDIISAAKIVKQVVTKNKGSYCPAPPGYVYMAERNGVAGHYGGRREYRDLGNGEKVRTHYGAEWYVLYVLPTFTIPVMLDGRKGSLEAITRSDGSTLITANSASFIGSSWIAVLDEGDSIESLLSTEDQEFLARERAAEKAAWGNEVEVGAS